MTDHRGLVAHDVHAAEQSAQDLGIPHVALHQRVARPGHGPVCLREERVEQHYAVASVGQRIGDG